MIIIFSYDFCYFKYSIYFELHSRVFLSIYPFPGDRQKLPVCYFNYFAWFDTLIDRILYSSIRKRKFILF